jgi:hypothetical protein
MRRLYETYARPLLRLLIYLNRGRQEVADYDLTGHRRAGTTPSPG